MGKFRYNYTPLYQKYTALKSKKYQKDNELSAAKNELSKAQDKLEKMKSAYTSVEQETHNLVSASKSFEKRATETSKSNSNSIDRCIFFIDEYTQTNL